MVYHPRAKYHPSQPPALVTSEEEEKALGWEWTDHPNDVAVPPEEPKPEPEPESIPEAPARRGPGRPKLMKDEENG